jgi:hypothetical protein
MRTRDSDYWTRVQRRANTLSPDLRREVLSAFRVLRESLNDAELARLIASGEIDKILDEALVDRAFRPLRDRIFEATRKGFESNIKDLPVRGRIGIAFDTLAPRVIDGIRQLDSRVIQELKDNVRNVVRAHVENGLRDGKNARAIGRTLRDAIGLGVTQEENAAKYEAKLRALTKDPLTEEQIARKVAAYRSKAVRFNAEVTARTATLDALKLGQKLSVDDAITVGALDPERLVKTWLGVLDSRERPEHVAMQGETVPYSQPYSNGQMIPGETEYNCRCISKYTQLTGE